MKANPMVPSRDVSLGRVAALLEQAAAELRALSRTSESGLALIAQHEPCHESPDGADPALDPTTMTTTVQPRRSSARRSKSELLLTQAELADLLGFNVRTVRRLILEGEVPTGIQIGGALRWRRKEVEAWISKRSS